MRCRRAGRLRSLRSQHADPGHRILRFRCGNTPLRLRQGRASCFNFPGDGTRKLLNEWLELSTLLGLRIGGLFDDFEEDVRGKMLPKESREGAKVSLVGFL